MNRIPVSSTNVMSIGYDPATQTLEVEFHKSGVYQYYDVPESVYAALMEAESVGRFLSSQVKNVFRHARL